jgi:LCP family protein required for cell wall assembly
VPAGTVGINQNGYPTPGTPPATEIPTPAIPIDVPNGVVNILLMGSDKRPDDGGYRTDTLIVVSINKTEGTVNMLSLPRDLFVYIPGWTMARINTADSRGSAVGWPGGGPGLVKETLLYNFGITIHHYARVDFDGFRDIVDILGGIDVPVDCSLTGARLKDTTKRASDFPDYQGWIDYTADENNWIDYTLPPGVHHLDGYTALWYARVREGSSDFDRARRQQQVLRAILTTARNNGLLSITKAPELWQQYGDLVTTDMGLGNMLQFVPIAADIQPNEIRSFILTPNLLTSWSDPQSGASVFLPNPGAVEDLVSIAMEPPAQNYVVNNSATVEVRNGTSIDRLDEVAADRLGTDGLDAIATGKSAEAPNQDKTVIYDYTGRQKTNQVVLMQRVLRVADVDVIAQPDPNRQVDYVVILGNNYQSCRSN